MESNVKLKFKEGKEEVFKNLCEEFNNLEASNSFSVIYKYTDCYQGQKLNEFNNLYENKELRQLLLWVNRNIASMDFRNLGIPKENEGVENKLYKENVENIFKFLNNDIFPNDIQLPKGFNSTGILSPILHIKNPEEFALVNGKALNLLNAFFDSPNVTNDWKNYEDSSTFIIEVGKVIKGVKEDKIAQTIYFDRFAHWFSKKYGSQEIDSLNTIFYGPPGTGKTFSVNKRLKFLLSENPKVEKAKYIEKVVFHPNYGYEDFIDGIKPTGFTNSGQIKLELVNGHFKQFCFDVHKANLQFLMVEANLKKALPKYYFVVDEINRANLSAVFGETLMLLEDSYRYDYSKTPEENKNKGSLITLKNSTLCKDEKHYFVILNDEVLFGIPENIYFIGMMNDVDRSIDSFDLALRRRFAWKEMKCDFNVLRDELEKYENMDDYIGCCDNLNKHIIGKDNLGLSESFQFGHAIFMNIKKCINSRNTINESNSKDFFQKYIYGTLREYLRTEYPENEIKGKLDEALDKFLEPFTSVKSKKVDNKEADD